MSLDGKIATRSGDSCISSPDDLKSLHKMRAQADAVMIGIGTQLNDDPRLTVRKVRGRNPIRVVVDSFARTPTDSRLISTEHGKAIVAISNNAPTIRVNRLRQAGAEIIRCGTQRVDLEELLARLRERGIHRILLEGGGTLNWSMLHRGLVDKVVVTVAPIIVGGQKATTLAEGEGARKISGAIKLSLKSATREGKELLVVYDVRK